MTPEKHIELRTDLPPLEYCAEYLNSPISVYKFGPRKDIFFRALDMIGKCICNIEKENKPQDDFNYSVIEDCLNYLKNGFVEFSLDFFFGKFVFDFTFLAHNVNMNTIKNETIKSKCDALNRFSLDTLKFEETIVLFTTLTDRISKWKTFVPPSFKLSEHYFNLIKEV